MLTARLTAALAVLAALAAAAPSARAEGDADDFKANCTNCHTIGGGRLVGPDLKDVTKRQRREWLVGFINNPGGVLASGDPYAQKLFAEARNVAMAPIPGMTPKRANLLLDMIEAESKLEKSRFASSGISERAFTPADVAVGRDIYRGARALAGGGPACFSCHQAGAVTALGGGMLAPDLSDVFARLGGRKALGAWLVNPPTPTMKPMFAGRPLDPEQEILPLVAFLKDVSDRGERPDVARQRVSYLLAAAAGAAVALLLMNLAWKGRFQGVRESLVKGATR